MERLQKFIAHGGIASRRRAEQLIVAGEVKVNGEIVKELGTKVDPDQDLVEVSGKLIKNEQEQVYFILNKPSGYVTTVKDQFNRLTVLDLLKDVKSRIYPVGRLDYETEGLLLLTNDGNLAYNLTHPKNKVDKVYEAIVQGSVTKQVLDKLAEGLMLEDGKTMPARVSVLKKWPHQTLLELTIWEGRNRQVRRMMEAVGHPVIDLKRSQIAFLKLGDLAIGEYRSLTTKEVEKLKSFQTNLLTSRK